MNPRLHGLALVSVSASLRYYDEEMFTYVGKSRTLNESRDVIFRYCPEHSTCVADNGNDQKDLAKNISSCLGPK